MLGKDGGRVSSDCGVLTGSLVIEPFCSRQKKIRFLHGNQFILSGCLALPGSISACWPSKKILAATQQRGSDEARIKGSSTGA